MNIKAFQITKIKNIPLQTPAKTLDEMTCALPQALYTTFTTLASGTRVLGLHNHLRRLYQPAAEMGLHPAVDEQTLRQRIALLVKENLPHESRVRLIMTKNLGRIYIGIQPFAPLPEHVYMDGVHVITAPVTRHDPRIKDTGFISETAAQRNLLSQDVFEILLTKNGNIFEGMTSNFYVIKRAKIVTARRGILLGVTRKAVLRIARGQGLDIEYRAPDINEKFDEAFLTSSSRGVVPITSIDGRSIGQGSVGEWTKALMNAYQSFIEQKSENII